MSQSRLFPAGSRLTRSLIDRKRDAYSASDIEAVVVGRDKKTGEKVVSKIGDIQTLAYSNHIDATPVRVLGRKTPKGYTLGQRTTAGTLIFATFNKRALDSLYSGSDTIALDTTLSPDFLGTASARINQPSDTIPPFDIVLYFASENGNDSVMFLYRVQITDEGQTFSVQDVYSEQTMQYVAGGISMMEKINDIWIKRSVGESGVFSNANLLRRAESAGLIL